jgi:hypothetical protein
MNKIILTAETEFNDELCRKLLLKLESKVDTINERTKQHTIQIKELEKVIK